MGFFSRGSIIEREKRRQRDKALNTLAMREQIKQNKEKIAYEKLKQTSISSARAASAEKRKTLNKKYIEPLKAFSSKVKKKRPKRKYKGPSGPFAGSGGNPFQ